MGTNIRNFEFNKIDMRLSNSEYWDTFLGPEDYPRHVFDGILSGDCLVVHYDFNESGIYASQGIDFGDTIYSLTTWTGATNGGINIGNYGLTGIDNGAITFIKSSADTANTALLSALTGTTLVIPSADTRLCLNRVTGMTGNYEYPISFAADELVGDYAELCGGFYQGFYKLDGEDYDIFPNRVPKGWMAEVWLNKSDDICSGVTATTLNDTYPDNKGFFLYFGTRAENKFWNIFEGNNTGCTSMCVSDSACTGTVTTFCTIPKEIDVATSSGYPLSPPPLEITEIDNEFLIYHRGGGRSCGSCGNPASNCTCRSDSYLKGLEACDITGSSVTITQTATTKTLVDTENPFLIYHRSDGRSSKCGCRDNGPAGRVACEHGDIYEPLDELDISKDIIDNALGFRVKDDGSIGYRLMTVSCSGETSVVTIEESYSQSGCVKDNEWTNISIRYVADTTYDECQLQELGPRNGKLMFYVNCKLKFVVNDFSEFIARRLMENQQKQIGVPFNISLGGGSQGLTETMTFDGQDPDDLNQPIQENFAGTFIGGMSQFRFYMCDVDYCTLKNNCEQESDRYFGEDTCFLLQENGSFVLQQDCFKIIIDKDTNFLLQQDAFNLLQENGFKIKWLP